MFSNSAYCFCLVYYPHPQAGAKECQHFDGGDFFVRVQGKPRIEHKAVDEPVAVRVRAERLGVDVAVTSESVIRYRRRVDVG